jgi:AraC-like DNA-binding protein
MYASRERTRLLGRWLPRRRTHVLVAHTADAFAALFRSSLIDAALVDLAATSDDTVRAAVAALEFPSVAFLGVLQYRTTDAPTIAMSADLGFVDVVAESVDAAAVPQLVKEQSFSTRFAAALDSPPEALGLATPLQLSTWRAIIAHAGRAVRTSELARTVGVTREHLSRTFAAAGAPNLKRIIDLVRLLSAAELSKNPGYGVHDVARVLDFASSSHLGSAAQRLVGTTPRSLSRLRSVDLLDRFVRGRGRSRG